MATIPFEKEDHPGVTGSIAAYMQQSWRAEHQAGGSVTTVLRNQAQKWYPR
jgi:hypothetical protein